MTRQPNTAADVRTLVEMLHTRRPHGSKTERQFLRRYIAPLAMKMDDYGNLYKQIGTDPIAWSCHTDTVHKCAGTQRIRIKGETARLSHNTDSNCLGADDTAGIWLMREMIVAQKPGLYIFHRGEECGGLGSDYIATNTPDLLANTRHIIALDRRGTSSVITHQAGGRCCSDAFATELAARLDLNLAPDSTGMFTDTANYMGFVPECTNVSVGYSSEHTSNESLNLDYLINLRESLLRLDTEGLPVARDPSAQDPAELWTYGYDQEPDGLGDLVRRYPDEIADILRDYGISANDIRDDIFERYGHVPF